MAKNKTKPVVHTSKHSLADDLMPIDSPAERPTKKAKLLDDTDSEAESDNGGAGIKVNEEYARRFEHNKKRAERHRLEEKYGKSNGKIEDVESEEDSEEDVSEDDEGELATEALDAEISATLNAIRSKDPRVYNNDVKFYREVEEDSDGEATSSKREKAMTLKDYHTKNLLEGKFDDFEDDSAPVKTHAQEMEDVKQSALQAIKEAAGSDDEEEDDFLVAKQKPEKKKRVKITEQDVENADKDPDTFLSIFLASRAWVPTDKSHWKPLESDDEEEEEAAEEYEAAYNMYFEDPSGANEKIVTYARDAVASTTVRREEKKGRRRAREIARAKREAERKEREEEMARLRKLRVEEMEDKVKQIRKMGGFTGRDFNMEEWTDVLEADWSDEKWDEEMRKRFGDAYYNEAGDEEVEVDEAEDAPSSKSKKPKKPKFDDDIDIKDLIPDFDDEEAKPPTALSSDDEAAAEEEEDEDPSHPTSKSKSKSSKHLKQARAEAKSTARRDRRLIENLVDASLEYDPVLATTTSKSATGFRYRETSPTTFGLTPRDILLASDAQLNEFAGLKKLATFRDPVKKKRDKKSLSKKARLRQWRLDTFGDPEGPRGGFEVVLGEEAGEGVNNNERKRKADEGMEVDIREGEKKKKRRSRKKKAEVGA